MAEEGPRRRLFGRAPRRAGSFAMIQPQRVRATSSALHHVEEHAAERAPDRAWQSRAYELVDQIGEVGYLLNLKASVVAACNLQPQVFEKGKWIEDVDDKVLRVMGAFVGPQGGQRELKRRAALHLATGGESFLLGSTPEGPEEQGILWEFLSTDEIQVQSGDGKVRRRRDGLQAVELAGDYYLARAWRSHPRFCADDQTEILTSVGWRDHRSLRVGHEALTLNHETGLSEWQPVEAVNRFDVVDEVMRSMETSTHSSLTTMDHRWPTTVLRSGDRRWTTSRDLKSTDLIVAAADCADVPTEPKYSDAFVELVAWYWTEGSVREPVIHQSLRANPQHVESIRATLTEIFGPPTEDDMRHGHTAKTPVCSFPGCGWPSKANVLCNAHNEQRRHGVELHTVNRRVDLPPPKPELGRPEPAWREYHDPRKGMVAFRLNETAADELMAVAPDRQVDLNFIFHLTRAQLELFIRRSLDADGHVTENGTAVIAQKARRMLESFELACILAGYTPRTVKREYEAWTRWEVTVGRSPRMHVSRMRNDTAVYTGTVWCPTTRNRTWLARRNGKVFFTGNSDLADSELRRVLPICEEILTLSQMVDAQAKSRLSADLLYVPEEVSFASEDSEHTDEAEQDGMDSFTKELMDHLSEPITDRTSAASLVPLIMRGPADMADKIKIIQLGRDETSWAQTLREEALQRLAQGLNSPPELMAGKQTLNHWTAYNVDMAFITQHAAPDGELLADFVTFAYLRPMLEEFEQMSHADAQMRRLFFDASPVMSGQDEGGAALKIHALDPTLLSNRALILANGFEESQRPDEDEIFQRQVWSLIEKLPQYFGKTLLPLLTGWDKIDLSELPVPAVRAAAGAAPGTETGPGDVGTGAGGDVPPVPTPAAQSPPTAGQPGQASAMHLQLHVASDAALGRAIEKAATKLHGRINKLPEDLRGRLRTVDRRKVLQMVTAADLVSAGLSADDLLDRAWDDLSIQARVWVRDWLISEGVDDMAADERGALCASLLAGAMQRFTLVNLHCALAPRHRGMRVPAELVQAALEPALTGDLVT